MTANASDQPRLDLENGLAAISAAEEELRCAALRITQRMRTDSEREDLELLNAARMHLRRAMGHLSKLHPDRTG